MRFYPKTVFLLAAFLVALVLVGPALSQGPPIQIERDHPIRLQVGTFIPTAGQTLNLPADLQTQAVSSSQPLYYIVQFVGPVESSWKDGIAELGGQVSGYIPDYAFKVRLTSQQAAAVQALPYVTWVGVFEPAYRLDPDLNRGQTNLYKVRFEPGLSSDSQVRQILATGAQVVRLDDNFAVVAANSGQLDALAHIVEVAWIENFVFYEKHNEYGAGVIIGANVANSNGYDGSTQIVAVADTGLGTGSAATAHPDVPPGRITAIQDFPATSAAFCYNAFPDGAQDPDSGHGTHTALSVLGDGGPGGIGQGTAPAANLVFQSIEDYIDTFGACAGSPDGYYLIGIPDNLNNLYQPAYNVGARFHSNSWGSDAAGDYTADSAATDQFMWNNPDMLVTFSAGNAGADNNNNGVVDNDSIGSPATAKNVLTVGASEGERTDNFPCDTGLGYTSSDSYQAGQTCASMGGTNTLGTAGQRWGFSTEPLFSDVSGGNSNQMAPFSSRGPTDDGRIKPDVVAPGTWILSGYSEMYQQGYDPGVNPQNGAFQSDGWGMPLTDDYKYFGGTSMSNPIAAGGAAVVRDFYQKSETHTASAALTKATLINSAVDLLDENNDGANDNDFPIPNVHEGWGRLDLAAATDGSHVWVDDASGVSTGGSFSNGYAVPGGGAFKVTLVWSDFPSTETAAANLVNDLDLTVTSPGGTTYRGNVFANGWSTSGGSADGTNNVENVYIQNAQAGTWTVTVSGANVPQGPQPFALVIDGVSGTAPTPTPGPTATPAPPTPTNTPSPIVCTTYSSSDTPIVLPNGTASISSNISVSGTTGNIIDVNVSIDMPHAWPGDLDFQLTSPQSSNVTLIDRPGVPASTFGCSVDDIDVTLDDAADSPVENACNASPPAISGVLSPNQPLAALNGQGANGIWTLTVNDNYTSADAGTLNSWSVEICREESGNPTATPPPTATPTNTPVPPTPTNTPLPTATDTPGPTATNTPLPTATNTPLPTATPVPPTPTPTPPPGGADVIYVSSSSGGNAGGVSFADEDILAFDTGTGVWSRYFDGSDVGLSGSGARDVDAFHILDDGSILISIVSASTIPDVGSIDDSDIVRFVPTSLGDTTAGTFELYFDGSDVGLTTNGEDVDAIHVTAAGDLLISTAGGYNVPGASGSDEDMIRFTPTSLGSATSGSWAILFDGSDVALNNSSDEDVWGIWQDEATGDLTFTTRGTFSVAGASGDGADIATCGPGSLGTTTSCSFSLLWDGSAFGYGGERMDGLSISRP